MSLGASGKIGERLVFSQRKSGQQARFQKAQKDKISLPRCTSRFLYSLSVITWKYLTQAQKDVYIALAKNLNMTGYNYFVKQALLDPKTYLGLVGYWPMNESSGATLYNHSGQGNNGILSPSYPSNCPARVDSFNKKFGKAILQVVGQYSLVLNYSDLSALDANANSYTFGIWAKSANPGNMRLFDVPGTSYYIQFLGTATSCSSYVYDGTYNPGVGFGNPWNNKWRFLVFVVDFSSKKLLAYLDGVFVGSVNNTVQATTKTSANLWIGNNTGLARTFLGSLDSPFIFNRALSAGEIKEIYSKALNR